MFLVAIRHVNFTHSSANQAHQDAKSSLDLLAGAITMMPFYELFLIQASVMTLICSRR